MPTPCCSDCGDELAGEETLCRECANEAGDLCRWCGERPPAPGCDLCSECDEHAAIVLEAGSFDIAGDVPALAHELAALPGDRPPRELTRDPRGDEMPAPRTPKRYPAETSIPPGLEPTLGLLVKLASIARHVEEASGPGGHEFDLAAARSLLSDHELREWMARADALALLPVAR